MRCRYAHFYCGFFLELKGEHTQAAPFLEAAAAQPSGDYMGKLMPLHWGAFRRRWEQRAPVQAAYNPLPNSREIQRGRALAIA